MKVIKLLSVKNDCDDDVNLRYQWSKIDNIKCWKCTSMSSSTVKEG